MSQERSHELMDIYLNEVLGNRRFEKVADIAHPELLDHTQPGKRGVEALAAHAEGFFANTPDAGIEVLNISATADMAFGIWRWTGEPHMPSAVSASGNRVVPRNVCSVFDVKDGKIAEYRVFVDAVDVFSQLAQ